MSTTSNPDPRLGTVLGGRFRIDSVLGQGGMGTVYRGTQLSVDRQVAIKLISHQVATQPEYVQRFSREAKVTSQLSHPHTIRLHEFGTTDDGALYLVVELLHGRELSRLLEEEGALPPARALELVRRVLKSLAEAHAKGIVHRDLKPDNIFMCDVPGEGDFPKVMDFGIASAGAAAADATKLTLDGSLLGTPAYMSPEQAQGAPAGPPADIYALGIVLYELLTGQLPFNSNSPLSLLMKHVNEAPPPLRALLPVYGPEHPVQQLLDRWLAKDPAARPANAQQALTELEAAMDGKAPEATGSGSAWDTRDADDAPGEEGARPSTMLSTLARHDDGRRARALGFASLAVLAVGGLVAWSIVTSRPSSQPQEEGRAAHVDPEATAGRPLAAAVEDEDEALAPNAEHDTAPPATDEEAPATAADDGEQPEATQHEAPTPKRATRPRRAAAKPEPPREASPPAAKPAPTARRTTVESTPPGTRAKPTAPPTKPIPAPKAPETHKEARLRMAAEGTPYPSIAAVKAAYRAGRIAEDDYEDVVWALKRRYKLRIRDLKLDLRAGKIDRPTYDRLARAAEGAYRGR